MTKKRMRTVVLVLIIAIGGVAFGDVKPVLANEALEIQRFTTAQPGESKIVKIKAQSYKVLSVKSNSSNKTVADVKATKKKLTISGKTTGRALISTSIRARLKGTVKTYRFNTTVIVSDQTGVNLAIEYKNEEVNSVKDNAKESKIRKLFNVSINGVKAKSSDVHWGYTNRYKTYKRYNEDEDCIEKEEVPKGFRNYGGLKYDGALLDTGRYWVIASIPDYYGNYKKDYNSNSLTFFVEKSNTVLKKYAIKVKNTSGGTLKLSATKASAGTKIIVTAEPESGYRIKRINVKVHADNPYAFYLDKVEGESNSFEFTMLGHKVTLAPEFVKE